MRVTLLLVGALLLASGLTAAEPVVLKQEGDATASVLAVTGQGNAFCGGTQCVAATLDGSAGCYGPFCAAVGEDGANCFALFCGAVSVYGDSTAGSRPINQHNNVVAAISVFGDATSDGFRGWTTDLAISGTGDASTENGIAISLTGHASARGNNGMAISGCDEVSALCMDPY
jgi:hypothetical protein